MPDKTPTNQKTLSGQGNSSLFIRSRHTSSMKRPIQQYEQFIRNGTISPKNKPKGPALKLMLPLPNTKLFLKTWNKTASKN
jgi:hypothetical protein